MNDFDLALTAVDYIFHAIPAKNIVDASKVGFTTIVSCPRVPDGLTKVASSKIGTAFNHDPLVLRVAVLAMNCVFSQNIGVRSSFFTRSIFFQSF